MLGAGLLGGGLVCTDAWLEGGPTPDEGPDEGGAGDCPPCPDPPPGYSRYDTSHTHFPCPGGHTHVYTYEYNQNPDTCECFLKLVEDVECD